MSDPGAGRERFARITFDVARRSENTMEQMQGERNDHESNQAKRNAPNPVNRGHIMPSVSRPLNPNHSQSAAPRRRALLGHRSMPLLQARDAMFRFRSLADQNESSPTS